MKKVLKKMCASLIAVYMVLAILPQTTAWADQPTTYSTVSNSGTRHEVCTTLEGTGAEAYYTGSYSYETLIQLSASDLKAALATLMTSTHTTQTTYDDCKTKVTQTDCEANDTSSFSTLYTSYNATYAQFNGGNGWNREHVWPKSLGGFDTTGAGSDLHHIRPTETRTNSDRDNRKYGYVSSGSTSTGNLSGLVGGTKGTTYYEPQDDVKGDVARIILYVYVRYGDVYPKCANVTNVFQSVEVLLEWCALDPVDTWEMGRNEVVQGIQGNRNVFIDYPELAWALFDQAVPTSMVTPSGNASEENGTGGNTACTHSTIELVGALAANCVTVGYTGDSYCKDCNALLAKGSELPLGDHVYAEPIVIAEATSDKLGILKKVCIHCNNVVYEDIPMVKDNTTAVIIVACSVGGVGVAVLLFFALKKLVKK